MTRFIVRRLARGLISLALFQVLLFALFQALPYDFSSLIIGDRAYRALIQQQFGLDRPALVQYARWLLDFLRFDLGQSFLYWPTPVSRILFANMPRTLLLFLSAAILAYLFGIWLGKIVAWRRGGFFEAGATLGAVAAYTSFAPFMGFVLINVFSRELGWFPYQRLIDHNVWYNAPVTADWVFALLVITGVFAFCMLFLLWRLTSRLESRALLWMGRVGGLLLAGVCVWLWWSLAGLDYLARNVVHHLALPLITIVLLSFGETMMLMRMAMLETMGEEYVLMAQAVGHPDKVIRDKYVAKNAILPVLTRLALNLPIVLVGSLVIERVFSWSAMGQIVFNAIEFYDVPLLLGILSVIGLLTLIAHIVLDVAYAFLDPRIRYAEGS